MVNNSNWVIQWGEHTYRQVNSEAYRQDDEKRTHTQRSITNLQLTFILNNIMRVWRGRKRERAGGREERKGERGEQRKRGEAGEEIRRGRWLEMNRYDSTFHRVSKSSTEENHHRTRVPPLTAPQSSRRSSPIGQTNAPTAEVRASWLHNKYPF